jgi:hypothetical protein
MALRTTVRKPRAGAPRRRPAATRLDVQILELQETIGALVAERQALRSAGAGRAALEANRLELGRRQRQLAYAAIGRHRGTSGAGDAQDEHQRPLGTRPVLANERLAA